MGRAPGSGFPTSLSAALSFPARALASHHVRTSPRNPPLLVLPSARRARLRHRRFAALAGNLFAASSLRSSILLAIGDCRLAMFASALTSAGTRRQTLKHCRSILSLQRAHDNGLLNHPPVSLSSRVEPPAVIFQVDSRNDIPLQVSFANSVR